MFRCRMSMACSVVVSGGAVISFVVMMRSTLLAVSLWKRRSRRVIMPTSLPPSSTGRPDMLWRAISSRAFSIVASGVRVTGEVMTPASERFTLRTSLAWRAMSRLRWIIPRPPSCASAMARRASVTVSIAAETIGMFKVMFLVSRVPVPTSSGITSDLFGTMSTSSKVIPSIGRVPVLPAGIG